MRKIFLLVGEGKAVHTGRAYVEDSPSPHGMKVSEPETSSTKARYISTKARYSNTKARYTNTKARYTQFQVLETFIFGHYLMLPR